MNIKTLFGAALVTGLLAPAMANAAFVLDTGTPPASAPVFGAALDANDYYAAEFNLSAGSTVTSIQAYLTNAAFSDSPGDTFTLAIFSASDFGTRFSQPLYTATGSYQADGWNGATGLNFTATAGGQYWAAIEVNGANGDTALNLVLPAPGAGGTAAALAYAFSGNAGESFTSSAAPGIGMQVTAAAPVPLPAAAWLLGSGLMGLGSVRRRRRAA